MLTRTISLVVATAILTVFTACGEGGINDKKDNDGTTNDTTIENVGESASDAVKNTDNSIDTSSVNSATDNLDGNVGDINTGTTTMPKIGVGHYVDSAVKGVTYDCGNQNGVTDENGTFTFEKGKSCVFTLGNIVLRELDPKKLEDKTIVVEDNIDNARLLQTLDNDGNADNGIEITKSVLDAISASGTEMVPVGNELETFFQNIEGVEGYEGAIVSIEEAQQHIEKTAQEIKQLLENMPTEEDVDNTTQEIEDLLENS
jgi:hypothetical protein